MTSHGLVRGRSVLLSVVLASGLHAADADAGDGVREINQVCATVTGCFAGDAAGFPVTITTAGSHRLTSNLEVNAQTTAILVDAPDVGLDLGGFAILGPNDCTMTRDGVTGLPLSMACTASGAGVGIDATSEAVGLRVRNGAIRGMGSHGIYRNGGIGGTVEDLVVRDNGGTGVGLQNGIVRRVEAQENGGLGILAVRVESCLVFENGYGVSIQGDRGAVLDGSTIDLNLGIGVTCGADGATVVGSTIARSGDAGVVVSGGGEVNLVDNSIRENGGCGGDFPTGAGRASSVGGNSFLRNNRGGSCVGGGGQNQLRGNVVATGCNTITCETGTLKLGTFCPPTSVSCLP